MRFLKNKVLKSIIQTFEEDPEDIEQSVSRELPGRAVLRTKKKITKSVENDKKKRQRVPGKAATPEKARSTKNIVKNYGKAICGFAASNLALPYLEPLIGEQNVKYSDFVQYANKKKDTIDSIETFKSIFMATDRDCERIKKYKWIFQKLAEVFIKYFSVNWIFTGKITYKIAHLKFRFKILRRIQNPERFIYLKSRKTSKK